MPEFEFTSPLHEMLIERDIREEYLWLTINNPDTTQAGSDGNIHYFKAIPEHGGRILHAVVNETRHPKRVITVFFDRRQRKKK